VSKNSSRVAWAVTDAVRKTCMHGSHGVCTPYVFAMPGMNSKPRT